MTYRIALGLWTAAGLAATAASAQTTAPSPAADPAPVVIAVTDTANLRKLADKAGYTGDPHVYYVFNVPEKTVILGKAGGKPGIDTGDWPAGVKLALTIGGTVYGGGGNGGSGGDVPGTTEGTRGGDAIFVRAPMTILVGTTGAIKAGGGGGGGADGGSQGGSGGGGGFPDGLPGQPGSPTHSGSPYLATGDFGHIGSPAGGGLGGQRGNIGGKGGDAGQAGESAGRAGGGAGNAIRANGNTVQFYNYGQLYGVVN